MRRIFVGISIFALLGIASAYELVQAPIRFWMNQRTVGLFRAQFPDAEYFGRNIGISGLTARRPLIGEPHHFLEATLDLEYRPSRTALRVELVEQVNANVLATRNQVSFAGPLLDSVLSDRVDRGVFERYGSLYPSISPIPTED